ncbi:MAG: MFS transporter [Deltaproteobacteria bacterium]|nr:MFS transporter [Deltaproteobacteria bacterium]
MAFKKNSQGHPAAGENQNGREALFWRRTGPVLFLALIFFINFTARILLAPFLPTIERDLGIGHGGAGFLFFLMSAGYFAAVMGSGFLSSRLTHRRTIIVSCACVGIALLGISMTNSLWGIRLGLVFLGMATGIYTPSAIATITSLIDSSHWGKAMAIHELAPNLAFILVPLIAELFLRWSSWRAALGLLGAISVIVSIAFARYGRGGEFPGESPASASFRMLLGKPSFWVMAALFGLGVSSTLGIFAMLPLYLVSERQMDQGWANALIALSRLSGPFMAFLAGWATDKLGPRRTMSASFLLTGITTLLLGPTPNPWVAVLVFLQPALAVCFFPAGFAALSAIGPANSRNVAVSFTVPFGFLLGGGAIPTFIGVMGDAGSFALGFALVGGFILSGAVLPFFLKPPDPKTALTPI